MIHVDLHFSATWETQVSEAIQTCIRLSLQEAILPMTSPTPPSVEGSAKISRRDVDIDERNQLTEQRLADILSSPGANDGLQTLLIDFFMSERRKCILEGRGWYLQPDSLLQDQAYGVQLLERALRMQPCAQYLRGNQGAQEVLRTVEVLFGVLPSTNTSTANRSSFTAAISSPLAIGISGLTAMPVVDNQAGDNQQSSSRRRGRSLGPAAFELHHTSSRAAGANYGEGNLTGLRVSISHTSPLDELVRGFSSLSSETSEPIEIQDVVNHSHLAIVHRELHGENGQQCSTFRGFRRYRNGSYICACD